jgi:hypothetical protein
MMAEFPMKNRVHRVLVFCLIFTTVGILSALPLTVISAGDPLLEDIRFLVRKSGSSFRSFTPPLSRDEVLQILDDINETGLSGPDQEVYRRIYDALTPSMLYGDERFSLGFQVVAAPEIHIRTNNAIDFSRRDTAAPHMLSFPVTLYFADTAQIFFEPLITSDPTYYTRDNSYWGTNVTYNPEQFDMNMPLRTFIAAGGHWWNFQLGRDRISYGAGHTGNLAVSDTPDYYDFARLSLFSPHFKYSLLVSQMPLSAQPLLANPAEYPDMDKKETITQRYFYLHRVDIRLFQKISLGISEGLMVGDSPLELRFVNPLILFHSFFSWLDYDQWDRNSNGKADEEGQGDMTGSLFALDMDWAVFPSLAVYGQFMMNEFATSYERESWAEIQPPNGLGYLAGIEYTHQFTDWRAVFYGEFVYTDPYLYTLSSPYASFIWMRRLADISAKDLRYSWIGHPAGRDTMLFALGARFTGETLGFSADISYSSTGEHTIRWDWKRGAPYNKENTPSGRAEHTLTAGVQTDWAPLSFLVLSGYIGGNAVFDAGHQGGTNEYGLEMVFSAAFRY